VSRIPAFQAFAVAGSSGGNDWPVRLARGRNCLASRRRRLDSATLMRSTSAITVWQIPPSSCSSRRPTAAAMSCEDAVARRRTVSNRSNASSNSGAGSASQSTAPAACAATSSAVNTSMIELMFETISAPPDIASVPAPPCGWI